MFTPSSPITIQNTLNFGVEMSPSKLLTFPPSPSAVNAMVEVTCETNVPHSKNEQSVSSSAPQSEKKPNNK
jgi:hypothetical protein